MIGGWLISEVLLSPVKFRQLLKNPTTTKDQLRLLNKVTDNRFPNHTLSEKDSNATVDSRNVLHRLRRSFHPCEKRRVFKYNNCLKRHVEEVHCKRQHVGCLLDGLPPPTCKKNYELFFGENRACHVATSCSCA